MKRILSLLLLLVSAAPAQSPNFVFIFVDDMGWTGSSVEMVAENPESKSDFYQTPNIEKLAQQGMRFSNAYAPAALCTPSRAAILTGKTPAELHMTTPGGGRTQAYHKLASPAHIRTLPTSETTIAEILKNKGYSTAHLGKWHLGHGNPGEHGFDLHDGSTDNESGGTESNPKDIYGLTERACNFLEQQAQDGTPFYLQLSHYAVHSPVEALEESKILCAQRPKGERHSDTSYAAMTFDLDASIGLLLAKLDALNLANNTYVIFMSDNGASGKPRNPQNQPLNGGKGSLYEGGIRVPLIIRGPGIEANRVCSENVTGCDLFPTFCEWANSSTVGEIEGISLVPLLRGKSDEFQRSETALLFHYPHYGQGPSQKPQSAIIVGNYKLLKDLETGTVQLFDLKADLSEQKDLSTTNPEKTNELENRLEKRLKELGAQQPTVNPDYDPDAQSERRKRTAKKRS